MKYPNILVLLALFCSSYGGFVNITIWEKKHVGECGRTRFENESLSILNYHKAELGQFPWVARIGMKNPTAGDPPIFFCGGSLISAHYVVSDVNCGHLGQVVRLGDYDIKNETDCDECGVCAPAHQDIGVKRHLFGEQCTAKNYNDIIVMQLEKAANLNPFVQPICIPNEPVKDFRYNSDQFLAPGFGEVYPKLIRNPEVSRTFREMTYVNSKVLDPHECNEVYHETLTDDHICVGYPDKVEHPCVGDSGGPLVKFVKEGQITRAYLVGVAKYNTLMCEMDDTPPVIYSNVYKLSEWIVKQIKEAALDKKKVVTTTPSREDDDDESEDDATTISADSTTSGETTPAGVSGAKGREQTTLAGVSSTKSGELITPVGGDDQSGRQETTSVANGEEVRQETTTVVTTSVNPTK